MLFETNVNSSSTDDITPASRRGNAAFGSASDTDSKANRYKVVEGPRNRPERMAVALAVLLLCASACMQVLAAYVGDKTWLLLAAKMWLGGKTLYVDIVEVNPPLIMWFYAIPVWLSFHIPFLEDYQILGLIGLALCALSAWVGVRLISLHPGFSGDRRRQMHFGLLLLLVFIFFTRPVYFFDREHIFFVLAFPYMLRLMPALARAPLSLRLRLLIGLLAAFGFCIKPHTLVVFGAIQLWIIAKERLPYVLWSIENGIIYTVILLYIFCIWHFTPDYVNIVMPMAIATYAGFNRKSFGIFYGILAFVTAGLPFADFKWRLDTPYRKDVYYFAWVSVAFLVYALINNGWGYTYHPLLSQLLFLTGWMWQEYGWLAQKDKMHGGSAQSFFFGQRACAISLCGNAFYLVFCIFEFYTTPACLWDSDCRNALPYVKYLKEHDIHSFGALSEDFHTWAALSRYSGARFDTRYNHLWMVPELAVKGRIFIRQHKWIVDTVGRGLAQDLNNHKPGVVFVDDSKEFFGYPFSLDLAAFFFSVPEFKDAWSHYRYTTRIDRCRSEKPGALKPTACRYDVYSRVP